MRVVRQARSASIAKRARRLVCAALIEAEVREGRARLAECGLRVYVGIGQPYSCLLFGFYVSSVCVLDAFLDAAGFAHRIGVEGPFDPGGMLKQPIIDKRAGMLAAVIAVVDDCEWHCGSGAFFCVWTCLTVGERRNVDSIADSLATAAAVESEGSRWISHCSCAMYLKSRAMGGQSHRAVDVREQRRMERRALNLTLPWGECSLISAIGGHHPQSSLRVQRGQVLAHLSAIGAIHFLCEVFQRRGAGAGNTS